MRTQTGGDENENARREPRWRFRYQFVGLARAGWEQRQLMQLACRWRCSSHPVTKKTAAGNQRSNYCPTASEGDCTQPRPCLSCVTLACFQRLTPRTPCSVNLAIAFEPFSSPPAAHWHLACFPDSGGSPEIESNGSPAFLWLEPYFRTLQPFTSLSPLIQYDHRPSVG